MTGYRFRNPYGSCLHFRHDFILSSSVKHCSQEASLFVFWNFKLACHRLCLVLVHQSGYFFFFFWRAIYTWHRSFVAAAGFLSWCLGPYSYQAAAPEGEVLAPSRKDYEVWLLKSCCLKILKRSPPPGSSLLAWAQAAAFQLILIKMGGRWMGTQLIRKSRWEAWDVAE